MKDSSRRPHHAGFGSDELNAVIHSRSVFGSHADPDVIVGFRYKINGCSVETKSPCASVRKLWQKPCRSALNPG